MRPRITVLLCCEDEDLAGVMAYTLGLGPRYAVTVCKDAEDAPSVDYEATILASNGVITLMDRDGLRIKDLPEIASTAVILAELMVVTARKRGPRKQALALAGQGESEPAGALRNCLER